MSKKNYTLKNEKPGAVKARRTIKLTEESARRIPHDAVLPKADMDTLIENMLKEFDVATDTLIQVVSIGENRVGIKITMKCDNKILKNTISKKDSTIYYLPLNEILTVHIPVRLI